tara:strand:- start:349 stop:849 length:501 start_codon:yes stop_codon:yes gene_type:complete
MKQIKANQKIMKKVFFLLSALFLLNGCAESVALLGSSVGGASSGKILQSSLSSTLSYGVKHKTGKTPIGHMLEYAKEINPENKKEKCISFIESTRSEFCTIAKKQISITNNSVKKKVLEISKKHSKNDKMKEVILDAKKELKDIYQFKKSPRELAIVFQSKMKNRE